MRRPERAGVAGGACVTLECADLTAMQERLAAAGMRAEEGKSSLQVLTIYDPDGNMLELSEPVKQQ